MSSQKISPTALSVKIPNSNSDINPKTGIQINYSNYSNTTNLQIGYESYELLVEFVADS
jgi:hypothetical protein